MNRLFKNKSPSGKYFLLSNDIFDEALSPKEFVVFAYLKKCSNINRMSYPSRKNIAKNCNFNIRTIDAALDGLEYKGLVTISARYNAHGQTSNLYTITESY